MTDNFRFIDAHAHLHSKPEAATELLSLMDEVGIERTLVVAGGTISPELLSIHFCEGGSSDVAIDNESLRKTCEETCGRLLPFFFANPIHNVDGYALAGGNFFGLKLAPIVHGVPFADRRIHDLVETSERFHHPIYLHCLPVRGFRVGDLAKLAQDHPRATFILGHGGVGHGDFHGISQIKPLQNVSFEISGAFTHATRVAIQALGAERVLFGSEYPLQDPRVEMKKLECLSLPPADFKKIARENALSLLARVTVPGRQALSRSFQPSIPA